MLGFKVIHVQKLNYSEKDICSAILDNLIKSLKGQRTLILDYTFPNEVYYRTKIGSIFTNRATFLNSFHKGRIHIEWYNDKIIIKYNLFNYFWFLSISVLVSLLLLSSLALEGTRSINAIIGILFFLAPCGFFMSYIVFFLIPLVVWRYQLNKLDFDNYFQEILHNYRTVQK